MHIYVLWFHVLLHGTVVPVTVNQTKPPNLVPENWTATKGAPVHQNKTNYCVPSLPHGIRHWETGDCRQKLCVKCCFSSNSCQQMKFGTIHRANVLHSTDSKTNRETADIHISVNSSAKVVFLLLPKIFMILLGHVMHYTGRGWHQEIFFFNCSFLSIVLSMMDSFVTAQTKKASQWEGLQQFNSAYSEKVSPAI